MKPLLIAFNGRKRSGKNTAAQVVANWGKARDLTVVNRGFADMVKVSAMRSLGVPTAVNMNDAIVMADSFKESGFINFEFPDMNYANGITGRQYLKFFAVEGHRDVFGDDFWLDLLLPLNNWQYNFTEVIDYNNARLTDIATISDLRFVNEAKRVKAFGGHVVEIHRPGLEGDNHASELSLPRELVDVTIENDSSLEAFEVAVNSWMTAEHTRFIEAPIYE